MTDWKMHTPQYYGHKPNDWVGNINTVEFLGFSNRWYAPQKIVWEKNVLYRYRYNQPDILARCLALPQADRDALIAELQKPVQDWAYDVWDAANTAFANGGKNSSAGVIRCACIPRTHKAILDAINFLNNTTGATDVCLNLAKVVKP